MWNCRLSGRTFSNAHFFSRVSSNHSSQAQHSDGYSSSSGSNNGRLELDSSSSSGSSGLPVVIAATGGLILRGPRDSSNGWPDFERPSG